MATNPFEEQEGSYLVLTNDEGQHSLWPASIAVPPGWQVAQPADSRQVCVAYVDEHWTDLRPASLVRAQHGSSDAVIAQ